MVITQRIVALMRGEIAVESSLGKGTIVTVRIPFRQPTPLPEVKANLPVVRGGGESLTISRPPILVVVG